MKSELLKRVKEVVKSSYPESELILYGSRARGTEEIDSDWDVLILLEKERITQKEEINLISKLYDIELEMDQVISTLIYTRKDWGNRLFITPLYNNIQKEGIVI